MACLLPFYRYRLKNYGHLMNTPTRDIITGWCQRLGVPMEKATWAREFAKAIGKQMFIDPRSRQEDGIAYKTKLRLIDFTTIYRWYRDERAPKSLSLIIRYSEMVDEAEKRIAAEKRLVAKSPKAK